MPAINTFEPFYTTLNDPTENLEEITPSDSAELNFISRAVLATTGGIITVDMAGTGTNKPIPIAAGQFLPIRIKKVYATGTSASGLISFY